MGLRDECEADIYIYIYMCVCVCKVMDGCEAEL